ncbi:MAG: rhodanese-like domain-containing protein [Anaerolineaceae bacterium]|nr:rhodanese-like domain-containing protein [Anaerolineaceae bacterium]
MPLRPYCWSKAHPIRQVILRLNELPKNQGIICVCHSGNRSLSATRKLVKAGYNSTNLRGGMIAWSRSGLPMTKAK